MKKALLIFLAAAIGVATACDEVELKTMYMPYTRIANQFQFGFETTPGYYFEVLSSTNGVNWKIYTNFVATGYSHSITTFVDEGPAMQLFRVKYIKTPLN